MRLMDLENKRKRLIEKKRQQMRVREEETLL